jgi:hypothetical protein
MQQPAHTLVVPLGAKPLRLIALVAVVAVVIAGALVFALESDDGSVAAIGTGADTAVRADGGPDETGAAAAVTGRPSATTGPNEAQVASAVGSSN